MNSTIKKFYTENPQGKCTDNNFEFGNLHRKEYKCSFYNNGKCHYVGNCDRKNTNNQNLGWRTS